jgi:hypothetical protein
MIIRVPHILPRLHFNPSPLQSDDSDGIPANLLQFSNDGRKNDRPRLTVTLQQRFVGAADI